jgi:hypothetical protein
MVTICTARFNNKTLHFAYTVYLCIPIVWFLQQRLLPDTERTVFFLMVTDCVFCELQTEYIQRRSISVAGFSPLRLGFDLRSAHVTLRWTKWHGAGFSPHQFDFPLSVSLQQRKILYSYTCCSYRRTQGRSLGTFYKAMPQVDSRRTLTAEAWLPFQASLCQICVFTGAGISTATSVFPCQYHCTNSPYTSSP